MTGQSDFIFELENALTAAQCDALIARFESSPHQEGKTAHGVDTDLKRTRDLTLGLNEEMADSLRPALKAYHKLYPMIPRKVNASLFMIQRYMPGDFYHWHIDNGVLTRRQYVAIWYLNDVLEGGRTQFVHYTREIVPVKGKLALFPAGWTHAHRGQAPVSGPKYIATTWLEV
jgi:hypothetical protein